MTEPARSLAVVVLTWNGRRDTLDCLVSLRRSGYLDRPHKTFVVDNGSADGTEEAVRRAFPEAEFVQNGANLGFAGGNNAGMRRALEQDFPLVLVLNNDVAVPPSGLEPLVAFLEENPRAGAVQPLLVRPGPGPSPMVDSLGQGLLAPLGVLDVGAGEPLALKDFSPREIFGVCAAAACYRAEALREAGLFNEDLFLLLEDVDLSFRIRCHGWTIHLVPRGRVVHKRGVSGNPKRSRASLYRSHANRLYLALAYWPLRHLLVFSPEFGYSLLRAMHYGSGPGERRRALALWASALRDRRRLARLPGYRDTLRRWLPGVREGVFGPRGVKA